MKNEFIGFYDPTEKEIDESWDNGYFVFDANALLNLYRYSEPTRKDFLVAMEKLQSRLFLPHQVGLEFHSNRYTVIDGLRDAYRKLISIITEVFDKNLNPQLNSFEKHPAIEIESIKKFQQEYLKKVSDELDKQNKKHPDFKTNDIILAQIDGLFRDKVGKEFSKDEIKKIYLEGKVRYEEAIPPGYKDAEKKKKGERNIYGDLIIWKELIAFIKKEKKPLIFVTDDRKEDWWTIENGKTIRPREELIKEFFDLTGIRILIYNAERFLQIAKLRKIVPEIKETSIIEIQEVRKSDEDFELVEVPNSQLFDSKNIIDYLNYNQFHEKYKDTLLAIYKDMKVKNNVKNALEAFAALSLASQNVKIRFNPVAKKDDISNSGSELLKTTGEV